MTSTPTYHVLLVGIDHYPVANSLRGCVNDIDAIERLLLTAPGIGIPPEQIRITRLAAPHPDVRSTSRYTAETLPPTKANFIKSLKTPPGPSVRPADRVLIYYAGHGDEQRWPGTPVWHEALVTQNGRAIEHLFDVEMNVLIELIVARTSDVTILLDCCHSAGATRNMTGSMEKGSIRHLNWFAIGSAVGTSVGKTGRTIARG